MLAVAALVNRLVGPALITGLRTDVSGRSNVPRQGGVLLAANHLSFLDHFLLAAASPRPLRFLGKAELAEGVAGRVYLAFGMVPVSRGSADAAALELLAGLAREGAAVAIFPEGTRSPTGELFRFRSGAARIAALAQVPVVPVGLVGTDVVWPRGEKPSLGRARKRVLSVRFAPALAPPEDKGRSRREFTEELQREILRLSGQSLAATFAPIEAAEADPA